MKLKILREELLKGLQKMQSIVEKRTTMPILSYVLMETQQGQIILTGTDLQISFKASYPAEIANEGSAIVSAKTIFDVVKGFSGSTLSLEKQASHHIYICDGRTEYTIFGLDPSEFPSFPSYDDTHFTSLESVILKEMIEKTIYSMASEDIRYNLAGIYLEKILEAKEKGLKLRMVSTDGHRLSLIDKDLSPIQEIQIEKGIIIPKKGVYELNRLLDRTSQVEIGVKESTLIVKKDTMILAIRLLSGEFPNYDSVIPKSNDKELKVSREDLINALSHVGLLTSEGFKGVQFSISKEGLNIILENPDIGRAKEKVAIEYDGPDLECAFNPKYFIDALQCMKSEQITLLLYDHSTPCIIAGADDKGFLSLVMPMRLKGRE